MNFQLHCRFARGLQEATEGAKGALKITPAPILPSHTFIHHSWQSFHLIMLLFQKLCFLQEAQCFLQEAPVEIIESQKWI